LNRAGFVKGAAKSPPCKIAEKENLFFFDRQDPALSQGAGIPRFLADSSLWMIVWYIYIVGVVFVLLV